MKTKTYAQSKRERNFDWNKALAADCKDMSRAELTDIMMHALSWITCACGNQCAVIPRRNTGEPVDSQLSDLGTEFTQVVGDMERAMRTAVFDDMKIANVAREKAIDILENIEKRSAVLIARAEKAQINSNALFCHTVKNATARV